MIIIGATRRSLRENPDGVARFRLNISNDFVNTTKPYFQLKFNDISN